MFFRLVLLVLLVACGGGDGLLEGRPPVEDVDIEHPGRLTDGWAASNGSPWDARSAVVFQRGRSVVVWDLGEVRPIRAAWLQADHNDRYRLSGSDDGEHWTGLWEVESVQRSGLRPRSSRELDGSARYLRLTAHGGDGLASVSELQVFSDVPESWPPEVWTLPWWWPASTGALAVLLWGLAAGAWALLHRKGGMRWLSGVVGIAGGAVAAFVLVARDLPLDADGLHLCRAVLAGVAALTLARLIAWGGRAWRRGLVGLLAVTALASVACFYNLGHPQFEDARTGESTWVHAWDLRVYYPTVKYFDELGYDGLYLASVRSWLEETGRPVGDIAGRRIRDLDDYELVRVADREDAIAGVTERFSPERWQAFRADMAWFQAQMGGMYLKSLVDHGANATPAWMLGAWPLFAPWEASDGLFSVLVWVDPVLFVLLFVAIWRSFGLVPALTCFVVFGTTPMPWLHSTWAGSVLRHDWLVLFGLGVCALKTRRWGAGGALLAWAGMIRVFPAVGLVFAVVPVAWALVRHRRGWQPLVRLAAGAALASTLLVGGSSAIFGWQAGWGGWADKISHHATRFTPNHVGLRTITTFERDKIGSRIKDSSLVEPWDTWREARAQALERRKVLHYAIVAVFVGVALLAALRARPDQAALLGLLMVPILTEPSNYYLHLVMLMPLLVDLPPPGEAEGRRRWAVIALLFVLLGLVQFFAWRLSGLDLRSTEWAIAVVAVIGLATGLLAWWRRGSQPQVTVELQ